MKGETGDMIGGWAFIIGVVIALLVGLVAGFSNMSGSTLVWVSVVMAVLGIIVGFLNVTDREVSRFIIAAMGITVGAAAIIALGNTIAGTIGNMLSTSFSVFSTFVAAAVFIPALKAVLSITKD